MTLRIARPVSAYPLAPICPSVRPAHPPIKAKTLLPSTSGQGHARGLTPIRRASVVHERSRPHAHTTALCFVIVSDGARWEYNELPTESMWLMGAFTFLRGAAGLQHQTGNQSLLGSLAEGLVEGLSH